MHYTYTEQQQGNNQQEIKKDEDTNTQTQKGKHWEAKLIKPRQRLKPSNIKEVKVIF